MWTTDVEPELADRLYDLLSATGRGRSARPPASSWSATSPTWVGWIREHARLLALVDPTTYVVTHGEPGVHNQWLARGRTWLLDWESLLLAPRERDLATLVREGRDVDHDPQLVRLFDLEWRLSEIWAFASWLQGPHTGDADDRTALGGLTDELTRPHFDEHPPA